MFMHVWSAVSVTPAPGDLPNPGIEPVSPACPVLQTDALPSEPPEVAYAH